MEDIKFHIILAYYNRPVIVKNAVHSLLSQQYDADLMYVTVIDDGSPHKFPALYYNMLKTAFEDNFTYQLIPDSVEQKEKQGGSRHGQYMNAAIADSPAEYFIILCDDDALLPDYLLKANKKLHELSKPVYAFSHVVFYNPQIENYDQHHPVTDYKHPGSTYNLNLNQAEINPVCQIDGSQMICQTAPFKSGQVSYPSPQTRCLDAAVYTQLYENFGPCKNLYIQGQVKAAFPEQMGNVENPY